MATGFAQLKIGFIRFCHAENTKKNCSTRQTTNKTNPKTCQIFFSSRSNKTFLLLLFFWTQKPCPLVNFLAARTRKTAAGLFDMCATVQEKEGKMVIINNKRNKKRKREGMQLSSDLLPCVVCVMASIKYRVERQKEIWPRLWLFACHAAHTPVFVVCH